MSRPTRPAKKRSESSATSSDSSSSKQSGSASSKTGKSTGQSRPKPPSLVSLLATSLRLREFLRLILSQPLPKNDLGISKVSVRPVRIGTEQRYQWTERCGPKELHRNLTADELVASVKQIFGTSLGDAHLFTTDSDMTIRWNYGHPERIKRKPPTQQSSEDQDHNRQKQYLIPVGVPCPFLIEIGVMLPSGQIKPVMYHKFRQINRYLEFVEDLMPQLPETGPIHVVDFGCGKSYLTFALHFLLTGRHSREVKIVGLDVKDDVIEDCNRIATALGCEGLEFRVGRIEQFTPETHVHLAVSLHACDTATDDAIAAAIRWNSEAILAVPCCQHEVCQTLGAQTLPGLVEHGILKERFASLATDALRAQFLELHGYRTQVLEFIDTEHTPKNLLIRAIKRTDLSDQDRTVRRERYDQLKQFLGLKSWHLEQVAELPRAN